MAKGFSFDHNLDTFNGGSISVISEARLGKKTNNVRFAVEAVNLQQYEDGIWGVRPGTGYYGSAVPGTGILHLTEFVKQDKTRELIVISQNGNGYKSSDDGKTWTAITGASFTSNTDFTSIQFKNQLWISNGVDPLTIYNGTSFQQFTAIADPTVAPSYTRGSGLSSGSFTYYVRYTANNTVGYTNPSPAVTVTVNKPREAWKDNNTEYIDFTITAIPGATSYDLWLGEISGQEFYLGRTTTTTFRDFGDPLNTFQELPDDNTTAAPRVKSMEISGSRLWATNDSDNFWRVYGTGTGPYLGYFSPFYEGFFIDIERGGKFYPISVVHYRTGKGDPVATILCSSSDGKGTIYQVELSSITVGDVNIVVPIAYKVVGSMGADAPKTVVKFGDNIAFLNKRGVFFLRNKEQLFNILATDDMTVPIRDKIESISPTLFDRSIAYWKPPRLYFSVPISKANDTTFIWDDEKRNWSYAWTIGFNEFLEYTDKNNTTRFLGIRNDLPNIIEISNAYFGDLGEKILCQYQSPLIPVESTDHRIQARIREVIFEFSDLRGSVDVTFLGRTKTQDVIEVKTSTISSSISNSGVGDDFASDVSASNTNDTPKTFFSISKKRSIKPRKKVYAFKYRVKSFGNNNFWKLLSIQAHGTYLFKKSPSLWRK
jgi:hypothetical protein